MKIKSTIRREQVEEYFWTVPSNGKVLRKTRPIEGTKAEYIDTNIVLEGVKIGRSGTKVHFAYSWANEEVFEDGHIEYDERMLTTCGTETFFSRIVVAFGEATIADITCEKCLKKLSDLISRGRIIE